MATSSILTNVRITDMKTAEAFINALEASANDPKIESSEPETPVLTDLDAIRKLLAKRKKAK